MSSPNEKEWNSMISVQMKVEIQGDLSLANISKELDEINIPKELLKSAIIKIQEELVLDLCGPEYERNPNRRFSRAGTTSRTLHTRHGKIEFKLVKLAICKDLLLGFSFIIMMVHI